MEARCWKRLWLYLGNWYFYISPLSDKEGNWKNKPEQWLVFEGFNPTLVIGCGFKKEELQKCVTHQIRQHDVKQRFLSSQLERTTADKDKHPTTVSPHAVVKNPDSDPFPNFSISAVSESVFPNPGRHLPSPPLYTPPVLSCASVCLCSGESRWPRFSHSLLPAPAWAVCYSAASAKSTLRSHISALTHISMATAPQCPDDAAAAARGESAGLSDLQRSEFGASTPPPPTPPRSQSALSGLHVDERISKHTYEDVDSLSYHWQWEKWKLVLVCVSFKPPWWLFAPPILCHMLP